MIIRSCARLTYNDAQNIIDGKPAGTIAVTPEFEAVDVEHDVRVLNGLSQKLRAKRFQSGCLQIEKPTLSFKLDDNGMPIDCGQYRRTEANNLIEEVGLLRC